MHEWKARSANPYDIAAGCSLGVYGVLGRGVATRVKRSSADRLAVSGRVEGVPMPVEVAFAYAEAVLDCLPVAAMLIDGDSKILVSNAPARRTLAERDGLQDIFGRLQTAERCSDLRLAEAARDCLAGKQRLIRISRPGSSFWLLKMRPLSPRAAVDAMVMVAWIDPHSPPSLDGRVLETLFGLSPAEVRLAILLSTGDDLAGASLRLGISQDTARSHLKATFRKMGLHRQQELIRTATMLSYFD